MLGRKSSTRNRPGNELRKQAANRTQFNYYSSQSRPAAAEPHKDGAVDLGKVTSRLRLLPALLALAVIIISLLISLTLSNRPGVSTLNHEDSPYRTLAEYAAAAAEILSGDLGSKTKLTIDTQAVERKLLDRFPELRAADLRLPVLGRQPNLVIDIEPPAILLATPAKSYVLDSSGTVVSEASLLAADVRSGLLVIQDQSGLALNIGKQAVTTETARFITEVKAQLDAKGLAVSQLTLPPNANQLDIRLEGAAYYVKTDVAGNARLQMGSLIAVKEELERRRETPQEYIDVRVEGKVFYK